MEIRFTVESIPIWMRAREFEVSEKRGLLMQHDGWKAKKCLCVTGKKARKCMQLSIIRFFQQLVQLTR